MTVKREPGSVFIPKDPGDPKEVIAANALKLLETALHGHHLGGEYINDLDDGTAIRLTLERSLTGTFEICESCGGSGTR